MKKVSVSIFALLSIVFAVSSAFTTKGKHFAPNTWERFGVTNDAVNASPTPAATSIKSNKIVDNFRLVTGATLSSIATEISNYNAAQSPGQAIVRCSSDNDQVCAAIISFRDNDATELALVNFNAGDYSLVP
jgi:hypothetical protein